MTTNDQFLIAPCDSGQQARHVAANPSTTDQFLIAPCDSEEQARHVAANPPTTDTPHPHLRVDANIIDGMLHPNGHGKNPPDHIQIQVTNPTYKQIRSLVTLNGSGLLIGHGDAGRWSYFPRCYFTDAIDLPNGEFVVTVYAHEASEHGTLVTTFYPRFEDNE